MGSGRREKGGGGKRERGRWEKREGGRRERERGGGGYLVVYLRILCIFIARSIPKQNGFNALWADIKAIFAIKTWVWTTVAYASVTFVAGSLAQWAPTYMYRQSLAYPTPYSTKETALIFGGITCITGTVGTFLGVHLSAVSI